jgi:alpha-1,6-mannosyltransferase
MLILGRRISRSTLLAVLGVASLAPYVYALYLRDLRQHTVEFELAFFAAFALYAGATLLALRTDMLSPKGLVAIFAVAAAMQGILIFTRPTLSDDMYRYVWDGRVQAQGISPYLHPPQAPELVHLRDDTVWKFVNRKSVVTIYPPAAEMTFALLWRIQPDSVTWFQAAMALAGLLAGGLLVALLRDMGRSPSRVLIYLWSPLLAFETAHSAHIDGWMLPLLVGAWWARWRERDSLVGFLLGLATACKLYPAVLLPVLWRRDHPQGRWRMPVAFALTVTLCYLPYLLTSGSQVVGYLPKYLREQWNIGPLARLLLSTFSYTDIDPKKGILILTMGVLVAVWLVMMLLPTPDGETAIRRSLWPLGVMTLCSQNLFSWYMLWLLPLLAIFLRPGRLLGFRVDAWTGWWIFSGLVALSYTPFIDLRPVPAAIWAQFLPLYALLLADLLRGVGVLRVGD